MKTIQIDDDVFAKLVAALNAADATAVPPQQPPQQPPTAQPAPPGVKIIDIPFASVGHLTSTQVPAGMSLAFRFTVPANYSVFAQTGRFNAMPTDGDDYTDRDLCISTEPGDFSTKLGSAALVSGMAATVYFVVGAYPMIGRFMPKPDTSYPKLDPGKTYYCNVRQKDPTVASSINYSLYPPA